MASNNKRRSASRLMECLCHRNFIFFVFVVVILIASITAWLQFHATEDTGFASIPVFQQYSGLPHVTRVLHQIRTVPVIRQDTWRRCYPDWLYHYWREKDNEEIIDQYYPWFRKVYNTMPTAQCRQNVARFVILFHFGGIFGTPEVECLRPFEFLLQNHSIVFGAADVEKSSSVNELQTSFIYSRPRQTFWLDVISKIPNQGYHKSKKCSTAPLLNQVLQEFLEREAPQDSTIKVYPPKFFYPLSINAIRKESVCKSINTMNAERLEHCKAFLNDTSYVINHPPQSVT